MSQKNRSATIFTVVASVAALAAAGSGAAVIREGRTLDHMQTAFANGSLQQSALAASAEPSNRHLTLASTDGRYHFDVVLTESRRGFLLSGNLPAAGTGKIYQLWAFEGTDPISIAIMPDVDEPTAFSMPTGVTSLGITRESATGAKTPTSVPLVRADVAV